MNSPEDTNAGPVIRDLRRIDPVTGQVRDPGPEGRREPEPRVPGKPRPGRHAASKPGGTGARPAPGAQPPGGPGAQPPGGPGQPGAVPGAQPPGGAGEPGRPGAEPHRAPGGQGHPAPGGQGPGTQPPHRAPGAQEPGPQGPGAQGTPAQGPAGRGSAAQGSAGEGRGEPGPQGSAGQGSAGQGPAGQGPAGQGPAAPAQERGAPAGAPPAGAPVSNGPQATGAPAAQAAGQGGDAALAAQLAERTADLQRIHAEYANYRKRVERDRMAVREQALANVLSALLPVLDDIGRAREHGELTGGFKSVGESLETTAAKLGLESFGDPGESFDPRIHEALMHSYSPSVTEATAVQILQPGYKVGERIVRPARVAVAEPSDGQAQGSQEEAPPASRGTTPGPGQQRGTPAGNN
ncbi:MAG TPA: nucleotide exchange factor GrpE [Streptosporangiaceae bacterium]|nr:nucleotide exchange factor GrpE [Streptosporangiaceae bacterium]